MEDRRNGEWTIGQSLNQPISLSSASGDSEDSADEETRLQHLRGIFNKVRTANRKDLVTTRGIEKIDNRQMRRNRPVPSYIEDQRGWLGVSRWTDES